MLLAGFLEKAILSWDFQFGSLPTTGAGCFCSGDFHEKAVKVKFVGTWVF